MGFPINDISEDFTDGITIIKLVEAVLKTDIAGYNKNPNTRILKLTNTSVALNALLDRGVKLPALGAEGT